MSLCRAFRGSTGAHMASKLVENTEGRHAQTRSQAEVARIDRDGSTRAARACRVSWHRASPGLPRRTRSWRRGQSARRGERTHWSVPGLRRGGASGDGRGAVVRRSACWSMIAWAVVRTSGTAGIGIVLLARSRCKVLEATTAQRRMGSRRAPRSRGPIHRYKEWSCGR